MVGSHPISSGRKIENAAMTRIKSFGFCIDQDESGTKYLADDNEAYTVYIDRLAHTDKTGTITKPNPEIGLTQCDTKCKTAVELFAKHTSQSSDNLDSGGVDFFVGIFSLQFE